MIKVYLTTYNREQIYNKLRLEHNEKDSQKLLKREVVNISWDFLASILKSEFNFELDLENLEYNEFGKPYLKDDYPVYFNIAHAGEIIAIAISDNKVGIDIEKVEMFLHHRWKLRKSWNKIEKDEMKKDKQKHVLMARYWTRKRAYIKLKGYSLKDTKFSTVYIQPNNQWLLVKARDAYVLTVINKGDEVTKDLFLDKSIKILNRYTK